MDAATFRDWASGVQSAVVTIAVVVGGAWTATVYVRSHTEDEADARVARSLSLSVEARQVAPAVDTPRLFGLALEAQVENTGGRTIYLDLKEPPFTVARLGHDVNGEPAARWVRHVQALGGAADGALLPNRGQWVQVHSHKRIEGYAEVDAPGTYLITFQGAEGTSRWAASRLVEVASAPQAPR